MNWWDSCPIAEINKMYGGIPAHSIKMALK
jgi:hypothetical protein